VDENTAASVLDALRKGGTDVDRYLRSGALTIAHKEETCPEQGRFEPDWMISFLTEATAETAAARFSRVRTTLYEMTSRCERAAAQPGFSNTRAGSTAFSAITMPGADANIAAGCFRRNSCRMSFAPTLLWFRAAWFRRAPAMFRPMNF
jgi:hypothetical protein